MIWLVAYISSVFGALLTVVAMTVMRNEQRHNVGRIGWLGLILLSPPIGLILFLVLGGRKISAEHQQRKLVEIPHCGNHDSRHRDVYEELLVRRGLSEATIGNEVRLISHVSDLREAFLRLIDSAEETIYVMTFILDESPTSEELIARLCAKARSGVSVCFLCDGFGSFQTSEDMLDDIRHAGGKAHRFKPMSHLSKLAYLNFRNHRKLAVADGKRAILGGANLVENEVSSQVDEDSWIDMSLWIEGPAATQLNAVFCSDWNFVTDENLPPSDLRRCQFPASADTKTRLAVMPIGPDGPMEIIEDLWNLAIARADRRVWICTPYFVPSPSAMRSLELACRRGLDVRIVVPEVSDLKSVDYARYDYFEDLIELGATIMRHPDRMVHAKVGIVDDTLAIVGSANFDVRSFYLNYELSVVVHDDATIHQLSDWLESLMIQCERGLGERAAWRSAVSTAVRVFASEL